MYNHNKAQQSKNRVHITWDILYIAGHIMSLPGPISVPQPGPTFDCALPVSTEPDNLCQSEKKGWSCYRKLPAVEVWLHGDDVYQVVDSQIPG